MTEFIFKLCLKKHFLSIFFLSKMNITFSPKYEIGSKISLQGFSNFSGKVFLWHRKTGDENSQYENVITIIKIDVLSRKM